MSGRLSSEAAFQLLSKYRIENGDYMFWGSDIEETFRDFNYRENLKQFMPNPILCCQSLSGRATAMALMTYAKRREIWRGPIVNWLHSRRQKHSGWGDSITTALTLKALLEDILNSESTRESVNIGVKLEFIDIQTGRKKTKLLTVNNMEMGPHIASERIGEMGGYVTVTTQGTGKAVLQLSQHFSNVEFKEMKKSPVTAFQIQLSVSSRGRFVLLKSCQTWLCPYQTGYSGPSTVIISLPTGFNVTHDMIDKKFMEGVSGVDILNNTVYVHYTHVSLLIQKKGLN